MEDFEKQVESINNILEKGDKKSIENAETAAEKLKMKIQSTEDIEKMARLARLEVIIGSAQAFLGKHDLAAVNLESALKKYLIFQALNFWEAMNALTMLNITKERINVLDRSGEIISEFKELRHAVKIGLGE